MTYQDYKKEIKNIISKQFPNIDLFRVEMMMSSVDYKIRRHYNNGRSIKQTLSYINYRILFGYCF